MSEDWSREEVIAIVNDYFDMLMKELLGQSYNKAAHRRRLQKVLNDRSEGSIEFKHPNISAVLIELGYPYIPGYKARANYQNLLKDEVVNYLRNHPELDELIKHYHQEELIEPDLTDLLNREDDVPDMPFEVNEPAFKRNTKVVRNYFREELKNHQLGLMGEKFVISYEKERLSTSGNSSLADKIEHISQTEGDSAGFDILSFDDGGEKFIEVKTTKMGKEAPFYFTRNELKFSEEYPDRYNLYRVFNFKYHPNFYRLSGRLSQSCESVPMDYMGWPKS